jgi:hypothetical protein
MSKLLGAADVEFDGAVLRSEQGGATLTLGGQIGNTVMGPKGVNGHYFATEASRCEATVSLAQGDSVANYLGKEGTIVFRADTGQRYIITNAVIVENPSVKSNAGGNVNLVFEGDPAKEQL